MGCGVQSKNCKCVVSCQPDPNLARTHSFYSFRLSSALYRSIVLVTWLECTCTLCSYEQNARVHSVHMSGVHVWTLLKRPYAIILANYANGSLDYVTNAGSYMVMVVQGWELCCNDAGAITESNRWGAGAKRFGFVYGIWLCKDGNDTWQVFIPLTC